MGLGAHGCIYMVTLRGKGTYYIGQTTFGIGYRWSQHKSAARLRPASHFHRAIQKYGEDAFDVEVLAEGSSPDELNQLETLWIWALNATDRRLGFNKSTGGASPKPTIETRLKISAAHQGKTLTEEHRRKVGDFFRGRKQSQEACEKRRATNKGKRPSENTRLAVAEANRRRVHSAETRAKLKAASKLGNTGRVLSDESRAKLSASLKAHYAANKTSDTRLEGHRKQGEALRRLHQDPIRGPELKEKLRAAMVRRGISKPAA